MDCNRDSEKSDSASCDRVRSARRTLVVASIVAALLLATVAAYWQVARCDYVNLDDPAYLTDNPVVRKGLTIDGVRWALTAVEVGSWHPLTWISHMTVRELWGSGPAAHHLANLVLHLAATLLLFRFLLRATDRPGRSGFVAALFALHPLHVESVAWISERKDVLSALFWMLTLLAYSSYARRRTVRRYLLVVLAFVLGLASKSMLVTLPFVLLLLDVWPLGRWRGHGGAESARSLILEKLPLLLITSGATVVVIFSQRVAGAVTSMALIPLTERIANAALSYWAYLFKTVWPAGLAVYYPYPERVRLPAAAVAAVALLLVTVVVLRFARRAPYAAVGWCWYLGTLVPVIGLVQVGHQALADRYTYIPLIGLFIIAAWGPWQLLSKVRHRLRIATAAALVLLSACVVTTWSQVGYWRDSVTLFTRALEVTSRNYMAHLKLGDALLKRDKNSAAARQYEAALEIEPRLPAIHLNLGVAFTKLRKTERAIEHFRRAIELGQDDGSAHNNLGVALVKVRRFDEAIEHFTAAVRLDPDNAGARRNLERAIRRRDAQRQRGSVPVDP